MALAVLDAIALIVQALALSTLLASVVAGTTATTTPAWLAAAAGAAVTRALLQWATDTTAARAAAGTERELRERVLERAVALGPDWIARHGPAELTVVATKGLTRIDDYFTRFLPALVRAAVVPALIGGWILCCDVTSAALVAATVPLVPLFAVLIGKFTQHRTAKAANTAGRLSGQLLELIRALPVLTAFRRASAQIEVVRRVGEQHRKATGATLRVAMLSAFALDTVAMLSVALVAVDVGLRLVSGDLGLGTGLLVLLLAPECYLPLRAVGAAFHASTDGLEAVRRVAMIDEPPPAGTAVSGPGEIRVAGLGVRRRDRNAPDGVSFTVRAGEITRLDWPSGAGKSTVLGVLLGFVHPERGTVTVGGTDLSTMDMAIWREQLAWVPQRPEFDAETVAATLAAIGGNPRGATAKVAATHLLTRRIVELSTGERQRVALARALLRIEQGAKWLLLDEPTAHLDPVTAAKVMAAITDTAADGVGVLLATHRPAESDGTPDSGASVRAAAVPVTRTPPRRTGTGRIRELFSGRTAVGVLLGAAALGCGVALTATAAWLIAKASQQPQVLTLTVAVVAVRAFGLGKGVLRYLERLVTHDAAFRLSGELRLRLWSTLVRLGPAQATALGRTGGIQRLVDDTDTVRDLVPRVLIPPLVGIAVASAAVTLETAVLPAAGLVLGIALALAAVGGAIVAAVAEQRASTVLSAGRRVVAATVLTLFEAAADLIAFGTHRERLAELAAADRSLAAAARRQAFGAGAANAVVTTAVGMATVACAQLAASAVSAGSLAPVLAPLVALVPLAAAEPVAAVPPAAQQWGALRSAHQRVAELSGVNREGSAGTRESSPPGDRGLRLVGVEARWPGAETPVLSEVDLDVPAGTWLAVVGASGAGKSTLLALLLGFLAAERGRISLPSTVSWCPQEPQLVSTTVRENLRLGDPRGDDDALRCALVDAGLADWTTRLDVVVGAGGFAVSGGEARRLALARALLRADNADLVLLDEPTAHLDGPTATAVLNRLRERLDGRTVVYVTHRSEETGLADLVVEVCQGTINVRAPKVA